MKKRNQAAASFGIIGLGRFGMALATTLADAGKEVIVIDKDESKVKVMRQYTDYAFVADNLSTETLKEIGMQNCDVAVVCIGEKLDISILTTMSLIELGVPRVISKALSAEQGAVLSKLGAEVVYPERDMAIRLANRLETAKVLDYIQLSEQINISKLQVPHNFIGKTVEESGIRPKFGLNVIAVENSGQVEEIIKPDYAFREGDVLIVSGNRENVLRLAEEK